MTDFTEWLGSPQGKIWLDSTDVDNFNKWLHSDKGKVWLNSDDGKNWLNSKYSNTWLSTFKGKLWLNSAHGNKWLTDKHDKMQEDSTRDEWLDSDDGKNWLSTFKGKLWLNSAHGNEWLNSDNGKKWLSSFKGNLWLNSAHGNEWLTDEHVEMQEEWDRDEWLNTPNGILWLSSFKGKLWLNTPNGILWLSTPKGILWLSIIDSFDWLNIVAFKNIQLLLQTETVGELQLKYDKFDLEYNDLIGFEEEQIYKNMLVRSLTEFYANIIIKIENLCPIKIESNYLKIINQFLSLLNKKALNPITSIEIENTTIRVKDKEYKTIEEYLSPKIRNESEDEGPITFGDKKIIYSSISEFLSVDENAYNWLQQTQGIKWLFSDNGENWLTCEDSDEWLKTQFGKKFMTLYDEIKSNSTLKLVHVLSFEVLDIINKTLLLEPNPDHPLYKVVAKIYDFLKSYGGMYWLYETLAGYLWLIKHIHGSFYIYNNSDAIDFHISSESFMND